MIMDELRFDYALADSRFTLINYRFRVSDALGDVACQAKESLNAIDDIIQVKCSNDGIMKERAGSIRNNSIEAGWRYKRSERIGFDIDLRYVINTNEQGMPRELAIILKSIDIDTDRTILSIYDEIIGHPRIEKDNGIITAMKQIDSLRHQDFEVGQYLRLSMK